MITNQERDDRELINTQLTNNTWPINHYNTDDLLPLKHKTKGNKL